MQYLVEDVPVALQQVGQLLHEARELGRAARRAHGRRLAADRVRQRARARLLQARRQVQRRQDAGAQGRRVSGGRRVGDGGGDVPVQQLRGVAQLVDLRRHQLGAARVGRLQRAAHAQRHQRREQICAHRSVTTPHHASLAEHSSPLALRLRPVLLLAA